MSDLVSCLYAPCAIALAAGQTHARMSSPEHNAPGTPPDGQNAADAALLQRMAQGDQTAFAALYDRFSRPLFAAAVRILNDASEAEDIVHDVFLSLWQKARDFETTRGSAFAWAVTLTRNRAIDRLRSRRRRAELLSEAAPSDLGYGQGASDDSGDHLAIKEKARAVRTALGGLPAEQQRALELAFFSGLTQQEIAEKLAEPLGTVKARIRRGLMKLRDSFSTRP